MTGGFVNEELRCLYEINREIYTEWLARPELEFLPEPRGAALSLPL
jgi:hypothetical protein